MPPKLTISPPLLNSASPWASTASHLHSLLLCPHIGAVTTRTSLLAGFPPLDTHQHRFFDPATSSTAKLETISSDEAPASINSYGYSPLPLQEYLSILTSLLPSVTPSATPKTVIISITGPPAEIPIALALIAASPALTATTNLNLNSNSNLNLNLPLAVEINLSCPNIPSSPPPAYSRSALASFLSVLPDSYPLPLGIKVPPYTHASQFEDLAGALLQDSAARKLSFVTATNTLGSCLLYLDENEDEDNSVGGGQVLRGGLAGVPIHALSLGNVATLRDLFDADPELQHLDIIGVGGVHDRGGYERMRRAGAMAVGVATALGKKGISVFEDIARAFPSQL